MLLWVGAKTSTDIDAPHTGTDGRCTSAAGTGLAVPMSMHRQTMAESTPTRTISTIQVLPTAVGPSASPPSAADFASGHSALPSVGTLHRPPWLATRESPPASCWKRPGASRARAIAFHAGRLSVLIDSEVPIQWKTKTCQAPRLKTFTEEYAHASQWWRRGNEDGPPAGGAVRPRREPRSARLCRAGLRPELHRSCGLGQRNRLCRRTIRSRDRCRRRTCRYSGGLFCNGHKIRMCSEYCELEAGSHARYTMPKRAEPTSGSF